MSSEDPGVQNWIDTGGLRDGIVLVRWEVFTAAPQVDKAVREIRSLRVADVAAAVPARMPRVSPAERQQWLAARSAAYERRLAQN